MGLRTTRKGWETLPASTEFINRYVFPDGQLDTISNIQRFMEHAKFEIADVEALRLHYAITLRHWVARLEQHSARALQYVNEATFRVWRLYMAACALQFETGEIGIYQVLANKRAVGKPKIPLTPASPLQPGEAMNARRIARAKSSFVRPTTGRSSG